VWVNYFGVRRLISKGRANSLLAGHFFDRSLEPVRSGTRSPPNSLYVM
jgi:hypothetical protein